MRELREYGKWEKKKMGKIPIFFSKNRWKESRTREHFLPQAYNFFFPCKIERDREESVGKINVPFYPLFL